MQVADYFRRVNRLVSRHPAVLTHDILFDQRTKTLGFIKGRIVFLDQSELHLREFVEVSTRIRRFTYAYHYQDRRKRLIFRYDNHPPLFRPTAPAEHKHDGAENRVLAAPAPTLETVLKGALRHLAV